MQQVNNLLYIKSTPFGDPNVSAFQKGAFIHNLDQKEPNERIIIHKK